jgi:hypothetical protein
VIVARARLNRQKLSLADARCHYSIDLPGHEKARSVHLRVIQ